MVMLRQRLMASLIHYASSTRNLWSILPGVDRPWGKEIRGCLTAPEGYVLCGADMTSLEDTCKRHYMHPYDPAYVFEMSQDGFDPHLDLAKHAGAVSQDDIDAYNQGTKPELKALRKNYKVVNYSATYGVGAPKLSRDYWSTCS
jgi:DNA polymerase I-like protein with 3'-5' exonuclease and polymerase domains